MLVLGVGGWGGHERGTSVPLRHSNEELTADGDDRAAQRRPCTEGAHLTQSVFNVVLQKSTPPQVRQLIL